jgi:glycosyltransferase involved in cell wall biosynthesis
MRVLLVINGLDFGGTERAVEEIAVCLRARGHEVGIVSLKAPRRTGERLLARGIAVESLDMTDEVGLIGLARAVVRLRRLLARRPVDVVHAFLPRAIIVSRLANRFSPTRTLHVSSERSTDRRRSAMVRRLNRLTVRWTDAVLAVSPMVRDLLVTRDAVPPRKIQVMENGIDLEAVDVVTPVDLRREIPGLRRDAVLFCSVGRFVPEKGFVHLVRAFARLRHRGRAQLLLVGEGPQEALVRHEVAQLGLDGEVLCTGFRADVLGVLKAVDAYVLSSVEEGSPMVLLEAMACRLASVATDVSGVRELVGAEGADCAAIVVAPPEDWSAPGERPAGDPVGGLAAAMDRLVDEAALRRALAERARRRVENGLTLTHVVARLEEVYRAAGGSARRGSPRTRRFRR